MHLYRRLMQHNGLATLPAQSLGTLLGRDARFKAAPRCTSGIAGLWYYSAKLSGTARGSGGVSAMRSCAEHLGVADAMAPVRMAGAASVQSGATPSPTVGRFAR
ncbi:hypothetical protein JMJ55_28460 [Belnapia sp. T6]|uniref:Uncharacterized protein n=1 Tax=Belnapia mucosa TaxID=2804532 RepID=A0ABS1VCA9_9PROT|nr:hypothetical protein [Belnapia mucosa]MBL6459260.1 hypothetical protein [Belnapia mucosa]